MKRMLSAMLVLMTICWLTGSTALAQRGVGETAGVARQAVKPETVLLSGTVLKVETGPCENTTGRSPLGTHFLMKTEKGETLNVHLGPAALVEFVADELSAGLEVKVEGFRTEKMKPNHYVAVSLTLEDRTVQLRAGSLQPTWAGGAGGAGGGNRAVGGGWGRGPGGGAGYGYQGGRGRGRGRGYGQQAGRGPGWGCYYYRAPGGSVK